MYSQCPECHARFRVTAAALRAANGTVRCGRCGSAFNALTWLSDDVPPPVSGEGIAPAAALDVGATGATAATELTYSAEDLDQAFLDSGDWSAADVSDAAAAASPGDGAPAYGAEPPVVVNDTEPVEDITLEGEKISIESLGDLGIELEDDEPEHDLDSTDEFAILEDVPESMYPGTDEDEPARVPAPITEAVIQPRSPAAPPAEAPTAPAAPAFDTPPKARSTRSFAGDANVPAPESMRADTMDDLRWRPQSVPAEPEAGRGGRAVAWGLGCAALALAFAAQLIHHDRQDLARDPRFGPTVTGLYERLGIPLSPDWDVGAFELRQWGNGGLPDATGRLTVRASLKNTAAFAQPHPVLRLEFDDRYGEAVASRDIRPAEYLKNSAEATRMLPPGASANVELVIVEPDSESVGYQLDVCLPESATVLRCARGPG
ncbi:MAG: DUF3426 domain-containing protein [Steroidobacteraceae bacterium]